MQINKIIMNFFSSIVNFFTKKNKTIPIETESKPGIFRRLFSKLFSKNKENIEDIEDIEEDLELSFDKMNQKDISKVCNSEEDEIYQATHYTNSVLNANGTKQTNQRC